VPCVDISHSFESEWKPGDLLISVSGFRCCKTGSSTEKGKTTDLQNPDGGAFEFIKKGKTTDLQNPDGGAFEFVKNPLRHYGRVINFHKLRSIRLLARHACRPEGPVPDKQRSKFARHPHSQPRAGKSRSEELLKSGRADKYRHDPCMLLLHFRKVLQRGTFFL
jgi:hypothetical protein